jgi:hypothetical protein
MNKNLHILSGDFLCPHGDSNSSFSLERAASWSPRRWGHREKILPYASIQVKQLVNKPGGELLLGCHLLGYSLGGPR